MDGNDALGPLRDGHLDTVSFVMDYVEFRVSYNVLRALSWPVMRTAGGEVHRFPDAGSRDTLCDLIDTTVVTATELVPETEEWRIELRTDRGQTLIVPLAWSTRRGPEAAHLVPADAQGRVQVGEMWIW